jgi:hypothetical protein
MTEFAVPDCLVLKLEEVESTTKKVDTTVYIFYDKKEHNYVIRGQRRWSPIHQSTAYSFVSENVNDLADFLQYVICKSSTVNEILYNYDNFPVDSNDITFDFLNEYDHQDYEISGYNNQKFGRKSLLKNLRMLRNVFNYYN